MRVDFLRADPTGNATILVLSPVAPSARGAVAARLMALDGGWAEQVGFISRDGEQARMDMMGGEFCGNATRSAAVYTVFSGLLRPNEGGLYLPTVRCSGAANPIPCTVKETNHEATYWAEAQMPGP